MLRRKFVPLASPLLRTDLTTRLTNIRLVASKASPKQEEEFAQAREWLSGFQKQTIPRDIAQIRYDRSSGAGGQHVNTTDSKATATWPLQAICTHLPKMLHGPLKECRYYAKTSDSIVMQAQTSRKRNDNENECFEKLYQTIFDIARKTIPGETSAEQHGRVKKLAQKERAARMKDKKQHSDKKKSRRAI